MAQLPEIHKSAWKGFLSVHAQISRVCDTVMREHGLVPLEVYDVLVNLECAEDWRLRMSDLADRVLLSRSGLTRLVDRIEAKGLLAREGCPEDKRGSYAILTPAGQQAREEAWVVLEPLLNEVWGEALTEEEALHVLRICERITSRIAPAKCPAAASSSCE